LPPLQLRLRGDCGHRPDTSGACRAGDGLPPPRQEPVSCPSIKLTPSPSASPPPSGPPSLSSRPVTATCPSSPPANYNANPPPSATRPFPPPRGRGPDRRA